MRRPVRLALALPALAVGALALAAAADGHGPFGPVHGYVSTVSSIKPNVLGLEARVVGDQLLLRNWSGKTVTILGPDGTPYLRFGRGGVYLNSGPKWERVAAGTSFSWHDPRVAWLGTRPPEVVRREPDKVHFLRSWRVAGRADGKPFAIQGFLGYAPPPGSVGGDGTRWLLWTAATGALAALAVASFLVLVRRRRKPGARRPARERDGELAR